MRRPCVGEWIRRIFTWVGSHELATLLLMALIAGGVWAFAELADEVAEGDSRTFDERVLLAMRNPLDREDPVGPEWLEEMGRDFTALGGVGVLALLTLMAAVFLGLQRKTHAMWLLLGAVLSGAISSVILKSLFDRPRPDLVEHLSYVATTSFPSGHSMMSAVTYLTLGAIMARVQASRRLKAYLIGVVVLITLLVGTSRVYLGVHWPTDVLAGWTAGAIWAMLCWLVARGLQKRGQVEADTPSAPDAPHEP